VSYDTVANIVADAAAELGLGTVSDVFGSTDTNIIQLRTMLKTGGRSLALDRRWTHLIQEATFATRQNWAATTVYSSAAAAWAQNTSYLLGDLRTANGNLYRCNKPGVSNANGGGPNTLEGSITDGTAAWAYQNAGAASIVVKGYYYYTCTVTGTSGTTGPYGSAAGTEVDGTVTWSWTGNASEYPLPSDFNAMMDQSMWNRTNRLPAGGPLSAQEWSYLAGRLTGIVFTVLFFPNRNLIQLFPNKDTPGGYLIAYKYASSSWVSATGGTVPTTDAPTANSDILYFGKGLIMHKIKLIWLRNKGFDTTIAQKEYDDSFERAANADGSAAKLNLRGPLGFDPLIGIANVPITGYG
jgi:hypothetical protein